MLSFVQISSLPPRHRPTNWGLRPRFKLEFFVLGFLPSNSIIHYFSFVFPFQRFFFKTSRPYPFVGVDFNSPSNVFSQFILEKSPPAILGASSSIPAKSACIVQEFRLFKRHHRKSANRQFILEKSPPAILGASSSIPAKISVHRSRISSFQASSSKISESPGQCGTFISNNDCRNNV
ncbi:hypothetical protein TNIN_147711 [Trichonephila inaurata madagascariensis]|uniref:Uncharacterized protein n=1 Tax=Trichonephila inaurata madagascariensis TaxID=2747483 RepID=A0A8X6XSQ5_9ARAC|nr:hypothetical protein TNIN_147711 [Trichonephila inaurata madagascariensis]